MFKKDEYGLVLDFLRAGMAGEAREEPTVQVMGDQYFTLLELISKPDIKPERFERVYIGAGVRDKIERIKRRIKYADLTHSAREDLEPAIRTALKAKEADFVGFLNKAGPINIRIHSLELLPNVGKKNLEALLAERDKSLFQSYDDIRARVHHLTNIEDILLQRVIAELKGDEKYYLFVKIPPKEEEEGEGGERGGYRGNRGGYRGGGGGREGYRGGRDRRY